MRETSDPVSSKKLSRHLISHLAETEVVELNPGEALVQTSHLVLIQGEVRENGTVIGSGTALVRCSKRRNLHASSKAICVVFPPNVGV